jgi:small subunit ribosomal protein S5
MMIMSIQNWIPKTQLGKEVMSGSVTSLDEIFDSGRKISEPEIVDKLVPNLKHEVIFTGGSTGKGGGKRRTPTKRTTRMHRSGRRFTVSAMVVVGNEDGYFGIGRASSKENREAIEKAIENAKLNIIPIKRSCGSWECACQGNHSIPVMTVGKSGSVKVEIKPAPKGVNLVINDAAKKMLSLMGIRDIWSKSYGNTGSRTNYVLAVYDAFKNINMLKSAEDIGRKIEIEEPALGIEEPPEEKISGAKETSDEASDTGEKEAEKKPEKIPDEKENKEGAASKKAKDTDNKKETTNKKKSSDSEEIAKNSKED